MLLLLLLGGGGGSCVAALAGLWWDFREEGVSLKAKSIISLLSATKCQLTEMSADRVQPVPTASWSIDQAGGGFVVALSEEAVCLCGKNGTCGHLPSVCLSHG